MGSRGASNIDSNDLGTLINTLSDGTKVYNKSDVQLTSNQVKSKANDLMDSFVIKQASAQLKLNKQDLEFDRKNALVKNTLTGDEYTFGITATQVTNVGPQSKESYFTNTKLDFSNNKVTQLMKFKSMGSGEYQTLDNKFTIKKNYNTGYYELWHGRNQVLKNDKQLLGKKATNTPGAFMFDKLKQAKFFVSNLY